MSSEANLAKLQARMAETGIELAAIGPTANMRYLLGFTPHADERLCLLLVDPQTARMLVPELNRDEAAAHTGIDLVSWADADGPGEALRKALAGLPWPGTLAVDSALRADHLLVLQAAVRAGRTVPADSLLAPLRMIKSAEEIEALARAAAQADRAMQAAIDACRPGASEAEVGWAAEATFRQDGAEQVTFTLIASGPNSAYPHHHSGPRRLQKGDSVILDIGASLDGYKSDITRMVFLGEPPAKFLEAHAAVYAANRRAIAAVRPGVAAGEIDRAARAALEEAGYGPYFIHRTGHGLGLEGHEPPWIMAGEPMILQEGMVFSVEPGIYLVGQYGIRIEDIVAVTQTGARTLTGFDHALVIKD